MKKLLGLFLVILISGCGSNSLVKMEKVSDDQMELSTVYSSLSLSKSTVNLDKMKQEGYKGYKIYGALYNDKKEIEKKEVYSFDFKDNNEKDIPKQNTSYASITRDNNKFNVFYGLNGVGASYNSIDFVKGKREYKMFANVKTKGNELKDDKSLLTASVMLKDGISDEPKEVSNINELSSEYNDFIVVYTQFYK